MNVNPSLPYLKNPNSILTGINSTVSTITTAIAITQTAIPILKDRNPFATKIIHSARNPIPTGTAISVIQLTDHHHRG
jgi:hypothetical protein